MGAKKTQEEIIEWAKTIHNGKYSYKKFEYHGMLSKSIITCPIHGDFEQTVAKHIHSKQGCPKCFKEVIGKWNKKSFENFIERFKKVHGDKYDYSKAIYNGFDVPILISCPIHGEFFQTPYIHAKGHGCPKCSGKSLLSLDDFKDLAHKVHGTKYDYSQVDYKGSKSKVKIICPKHGEFWQTPTKHVHSRQGCPRCGSESCSRKRMMTKEEFLIRAKEVHGEKYDYSKVVLNGCEKEVEIICPKHGTFWQTPYHHTKNGSGCPKCKASKLEQELILLLDKEKINYIHQWKNQEILDNLSVDFYIPSKKIVIECQGIQHFKPIEHFGGIKKFAQQVKADERKFSLLKEHGIKILYYTKEDVPTEFSEKHEYIKDLTELINKLK